MCVQADADDPPSLRARVRAAIAEVTARRLPWPLGSAYLDAVVEDLIDGLRRRAVGLTELEE